jgi:hypothetical protein
MRKAFTFLTIFAFCASAYAQKTYDLSQDADATKLGTLLSSADAGSTIILNNSLTYPLKGKTIDRSLTIVKDAIGIGQPTIFMDNGSLTFAAGTPVISLLVFDGVKFTGTSASSYFLNSGTNMGSIGELKFLNCNITDQRGIIRSRNNGTTYTVIDKLVLDNCIVSNIEGYGIFTADAVESFVRNVEITNSTFNKIQRFIYSKAVGTSVKVENCTFYTSPQGSRYLIDYSDGGNPAVALNVANGISLKNNIFGPGLSNGTTAAYGAVRCDASTTITSINNYKTSDCEYTSGLELVNVIAYANPSSGLFKDASVLDFTIVDSNFEGKATSGDPRWYYKTPTKVKAVAANADLVVTNQTIQLATNGDVDVYTVTGKLVRSAKNVTTLSVGELTKGVYLAKVNVGGQVVVQKFVVR